MVKYTQTICRQFDSCSRICFNIFPAWQECLDLQVKIIRNFSSQGHLEIGNELIKNSVASLNNWDKFKMFRKREIQICVPFKDKMRVK